MGVGAGPVMNLRVCDKGHEQIVYTGAFCPLCEALKQIKSVNDFFESDEDIQKRYIMHTYGYSEDDYRELKKNIDKLFGKKE